MPVITVHISLTKPVSEMYMDGEITKQRYFNKMHYLWPGEFAVVSPFYHSLKRVVFCFLSQFGDCLTFASITLRLSSLINSVKQNGGVNVCFQWTFQELQKGQTAEKKEERGSITTPTQV